jgi:hypothetical protein
MTPAKPDTWVPHIYQEGARFHVVSYSTAGAHCSEKMCEINRPAAKPEVPKQDRAREIAEEYVNPGGRIVAALAIRAYGDERVEDYKRGHPVPLSEWERMEAAYAAEKERAEKWERVAATTGQQRSVAQMRLEPWQRRAEAAEAEVTRLREVLRRIEAEITVLEPKDWSPSEHRIVRMIREVLARAAGEEK